MSNLQITNSLLSTGQLDSKKKCNKKKECEAP